VRHRRTCALATPEGLVVALFRLFRRLGSGALLALAALPAAALLVTLLARTLLLAIPLEDDVLLGRARLREHRVRDLDGLELDDFLVIAEVALDLGDRAAAAEVRDVDEDRPGLLVA